jgi:hypothetical protein
MRETSLSLSNKEVQNARMYDIFVHSPDWGCITGLHQHGPLDVCQAGLLAP